LGDRVVDVHGGHGELAGLGELVESVHPRHALLHNALHHVEHGRVLLQQPVGRVAPVRASATDHVGLPSLSVDALVNAPPEVVLVLALPRVDREAALGQCRSDLV
ncbi:hypothetical protein EGW08_018918, partial [Elysia chlorotica]